MTADVRDLDRSFLVNWALPGNVVPSIECSESGIPRRERAIGESFGSIGIVSKEVVLF